MVLFDSIIDEVEEKLVGTTKVYSTHTKLKKGDKNTILFAKETAFELGGSQKPCASSLAVSSTESFDNSITLVGKDLGEIKGDSPFAKFVFAEIEDIDDDNEAFQKIKELEYVRYNFCAENFMARASAYNNREQIRVGKSAVKQGISLFDYGSLLMNEYLKFDFVKSAKIYFVTDYSDFDILTKYCEKISATISALNHILDNVLFDCSSCNLKAICDEVDGMKELHKRQTSNKSK